MPDTFNGRPSVDGLDACVAFQQGFRDPHSHHYALPQEILAAIYAYVCPYPDKDRTHKYVKRVSSYRPGFFNAKIKERLQEKDTLVASNSLRCLQYF